MLLSEIRWRVFLRLYVGVLIDPPFLMIPKGGVYILAKGERILLGGAIQKAKDEDEAN